MNTKQYRKIALGLIVILALVIVIIVAAKIVFGMLDDISQGNPELRDISDPLESELATMIARERNGEVGVVDISSATNFSWDRLFMFGAYTSPRELDSQVGSSWRDNCYTQITVSDSYTLLVFVKDGIVVHCLDFPKDKGNMLIPKLAQQEGLTPEQARFTNNIDGDLVWVKNK